MTAGKKNNIKETGDHNWDLERMQFEKDKGDVIRKEDYVNEETKDVRAAMGKKQRQ